MKNFNWSDNKITHLHIELTNHCNANCPFCPRFIPGTPIVRPDLKLSSISLDQFKEWFPPDVISETKRLLLCGTHGEPTMAKDFLEILKYVKINSPLCNILINSNGGSHKPSYWKEMGKILKNNNLYKDRVVFSIDGLEDTNHLYRKNINWSKLMENVKSYISTKAIAEWDFLTFKHNEHQIEEARKLSKDLGFANFFTKRTLGFDEGSTSKGVYNKNGDLEYELQAPVEKTLINSTEESKPKKIKNHIDLSYFKNFKPGINPNVERRIKEFNYNNIPEKNKHLLKYDDYVINCKSYTDNKTAEIYISSSGIVYPCCWVGTRVESGIDYLEDTQMRVEMRKVGMGKFNLNKNSLKNITKVLDKVFQQSWKLKKITTGKMLFCAMICGKDSDVDRIYVDRNY